MEEVATSDEKWADRLIAQCLWPALMAASLWLLDAAVNAPDGWRRSLGVGVSGLGFGAAAFHILWPEDR